MHPAIHASTIIAPLTTLAGLASFAFGASMEAIVEVRLLFVLIPLCALVTVLLGQQRPTLLVVAHFASLLSLGLGIYAAAAMSGADPGSSPLQSGSLLIGILSAAWASATLSASRA